MIIVGMSVIATVIVLQYHHHDPNGGNMPKWVTLHTHTWSTGLLIYYDTQFQQPNQCQNYFKFIFH